MKPISNSILEIDFIYYGKYNYAFTGESVLIKIKIILTGRLMPVLFGNLSTN